jgi:hypothetical protein
MELLISPTGGCRPRGLRYVVLGALADTEPESGPSHRIVLALPSAA